MQIQPGGQETGPTNRGHLRRTENQLIYDSFHPLRPPCGGAETLLAGLWGRTLKAVRLPLQENLRNLFQGTTNGGGYMYPLLRWIGDKTLKSTN